MTDSSLKERLQEFIEQEARSCSMDFGCVTPIYIYRMFGGTIPLREIEEALPIVQKKMMVGERQENEPRPLIMR